MYDFNHPWDAKKDKARQHNTTERQSNTTQLAQSSYFLKKISCLWWDSYPQPSHMYITICVMGFQHMNHGSFTYITDYNVLEVLKPLAVQQYNLWEWGYCLKWVVWVEGERREEREVNEETRAAVSSLLALISREYSDSLFGPPLYVMGPMYEIPGQLTQKHTM